MLDHSLTRLLPMLLLGLTCQAVANPPSAVDEGHAIAALYDLSDAGFKDSRVKMEMILRNAAGDSVSRHLTLSTLEKSSPNTGDKTLVVFSSPADVRDTALLNHPNITSTDDQWLYLPSIKRVKRISTENKSGPFVGSEFAFEDFTSQELDKYSYRFLRRDHLQEREVNVVERVPLDVNSGYSKQVVRFDIEHRQPLKIEFFDRKQAPLKTLVLSDYREYDGVWRSLDQRMTNHQTGKSTDLLLTDYEFDVGLSSNDFDSTALKRLTR